MGTFGQMRGTNAVGGGNLRLSILSVTLFAAAILALSLFPPIVRTMGASSNILPAKRVVILQDVLSGYATVNEGAG